MKVAVSIWNGRIAPVFDVSARFLLVETGEAPIEHGCIPFPDDNAASRADFLSRNGVELLVCGAISAEYEDELINRGIELLSFIAGPVHQVVSSLSEGKLERTEFSMPGCGCPHRRCRNRGRHSLSPGLSNPE